MTKKELKYLKTFESFLLEALSEDKEMAKDISQKLIAALSKTLNDDEEEALEQIMRIESKEMLDMVSDEVKKSTKMDLPTYLNDEMSDVDVEYKNIFTWIKELDPEMAKKYKENKFLQKTGKVIDYIQDFTWEGFLADLYSLGSKVLMKLLSIIVKTYQKFKHWREENPKTWRLIVICLLILIFIVIFSSQAVAAKTGTNPPPGMIDSCILIMFSFNSSLDIFDKDSISFKSLSEIFFNSKFRFWLATFNIEEIGKFIDSFTLTSFFDEITFKIFFFDSSKVSKFLIDFM